MKTVILGITGPDGATCDAAVVLLTPELAYSLKQKMDLFTEFLERDMRLLRISYLDETPCYVDVFETWDELEEILDMDISDAEMEVVDRELTIPDTCVTSTECSRLEVEADRVYWKAYLKHCDYSFETWPIERKLIEEVLVEGRPLEAGS
jgi:hypothetical protein